MKMRINITHYTGTMKKLAAIILISTAAISCEKTSEKSVETVIQNGNLSEIRQKKSELSKQQSQLTMKINQLNDAIDRLDTNKERTLVRIETLEDTLFKHYAQVQGDVATDQNIVIFSETSGILADVQVSEGQQVSKGQILATIDDGGLGSELARLETQAALAKTTFQRQQRLWDQNIGSEMQYLEAKANYEASQNSVQQLRTQLAKSTIRAPFSGIIDEIITEQGEVVSPGQKQLFRLVSLQNMYVEASIPENYLSQIQQGTEVIIEINSAGTRYTGHIRRISNTINPNNRTFKIEVSVPTKEFLIKPNQIATVRFNDYTNENALIVQERTVQKNAQGENLVYVWEPQTDSTGIARKVVVQPGYVYQDQLEITEGLKPGQTIITEGSRNLRDGQEVRIETNDNE